MAGMDGWMLVTQFVGYSGVGLVHEANKTIPRRAFVSRDPRAVVGRFAGSFAQRGRAECGPAARGALLCNGVSVT